MINIGVTYEIEHPNLDKVFHFLVNKLSVSFPELSVTAVVKRKWFIFKYILLNVEGNAVMVRSYMDAAYKGILLL